MSQGKTNTRERGATPPRQWPGYAVAVAATVIAVLIIWGLPSGAVDLPLYLTFYPVLYTAAVVGGAGPGVLATILSALATNLVFWAHGGQLEFGATLQTARLGLFLGTGVAISLLSERFRRQSVSLRESETRLRHFIDEAPVAISMLDTNMRYLAVSRRWLAVFSLSSQQILGRSHYEVFPDIPERWKKIHQRCLAGAVESAEEDLFERADGTRQWLHWEIQPWYASPGVIGGIVIFTEDVTARVKATEALHQSEERFRTMANNIPQLAWMARPDGYLFWFNQRCYEYSGCNLEQLQGWGWQRVVDPVLLPWVLRRWRRAIATGQFYDFQSRLRRADGCYRPFLTRIVSLRDQTGRVVLWFGTSTDITELKQMQEALRQSEERYRMLVERAPLPIRISRNGITLYVNPKFLEFFSCQSADAQVGRPITDLWAPECRAFIEEGVRCSSQDLALRTSYEGVAQRTDGSRFPLQVAATNVELPDGPASLAFFTDITELKQTEAELKRHREHLEEAVKDRTAKLQEALAELEHMSYSMIHDMRAPLRAMQGLTQLISEECADCREPPVSGYLKSIAEASLRLDRLLTDALNYNKIVRENPPLTPVDLGQLLRGMVETYPNLQSSGAEITIEPAAEWVVLGNASLLTQCFGNLLDNAVKFVAPGVHPRIRVWAQSSNLDQQPSIVTYVADNGIGIPKKAQEKIFHMFQRMHGEGEYPGTGIGLAIVKKAVERMGGRVGLESDPNQGTTFRVELLCATSTALRSNRTPSREER